MARIRTIKPKFFTDADIGRLEPLARLMFAGMWTLADREGRLEDNPEEIGVQIIPYDIARGADPVKLLSTLAPRFIIRYSANGQKFIQLRNFKKHQRPATRENESIIPPPPSESTDQSVLEHELVSAQACTGTEKKVWNGVRSTEKGKGEGISLPVDNDVQIDSDKASTEGTPSPAPVSSLPGKPEGDRPTALQADDKSHTIKKGPHYPDVDILAVAGEYCRLKGFAFANEYAQAAYLRQRAMYYPALDLLTQTAGDVARAKLCLQHLAEYYADPERPRPDWNWSYVTEDFTKWNKGMNDYEHGTRQTEPADTKADTADEPAAR